MTLAPRDKHQIDIAHGKLVDRRSRVRNLLRDAKQRYLQTGSPKHLERFYKLRSTVRRIDCLLLIIDLSTDEQLTKGPE